MANVISIPTIFTAIDKYSGTVNKMESSTGKFRDKLNKVSVSAAKISVGTGAVATAMAIPLIGATKKAMDFESTMIDIAKVAEVDIGSAQFNELSKAVKNSSKIFATSTAEMGAMYANLSAGGVETENLTKVADMVGKIGVAFNISSDAAGESFIQTKNALGATYDEVYSLMNSINLLDSKIGGSAKGIVDFMALGGSGVARALGDKGGKAVAAFGSALMAQGVSGAEAATTMERFQIGIYQNKEILKKFNAVGGGTAGMLEVIKGAVGKTDTEQVAYFSKFGAYGLKLRLLAQNYGLLEKAIGVANDAQGDSVNEEYQKKMKSANVLYSKMKVQLELIAIAIGEILLPKVTKFLEKMNTKLEGFLVWIDEHPQIVKSIVTITTNLIALLAVISAVSGTLAFFAKWWVIISGAVMKFWVILSQWIIPIFQAVIELFTGFVGGAAVLFVGAIVAIIGILSGFYEKWDAIVRAFTDGRILDGIMLICLALLDGILKPIEWILDAVDLLIGTSFGDKFAEWRKGLADQVELSSGIEKTDLTSVRQAESERKQSEMRSRVDLNVNDPNKMVSVGQTTNDVNVYLGTTMGYNFK